MSDVGISGVQLDAAKHINPGVKTDEPNTAEEVELSKDKKPPAARSSKMLSSRSKEKKIRADSAGEASATNALRTKGKLMAGRGIQISLSSHGSKKDSKENVERRDSSKENISSSQVPPTSPPTNLNIDGSNQVIQTDSTVAPSTTVPVQNSDKLIIECATTWSVITFTITNIYTGVHVIYSLNGDETIIKFYAWILLPICITVQAISFLLKPRRTDFAYKTFLYLQYFLFIIVPEILTMAGFSWEQHSVLVSFSRCLIWLGLLSFAMQVRARVARLCDEDLSDFLSMSVVRGGLFVGSAQLAFLAFSSVQCRSEAR